MHLKTFQELLKVDHDNFLVTIRVFAVVSTCIDSENLTLSGGLKILRQV